MISGGVRVADQGAQPGREFRRQSNRRERELVKGLRRGALALHPQPVSEQGLNRGGERAGLGRITPARPRELGPRRRHRMTVSARSSAQVPLRQFGIASAMRRRRFSV